MDLLNGLLESIMLYGFAIINNNQKELIEVLRAAGIIHLFNIHKLGEYVVIEINVGGCERECSIDCRDGNGLINSECLNGCIDSCVVDKLKNITKIVLERIGTRNNHHNA